MQQSGNFSLYFHVPFCTRKCDYCHFYVIPDQERFKELYLKSLQKEWILRSSQLPQSGLVSVYFGGGTPSLIGPQAIEEILSWISPPSQCEITLEVNPENVSRAQMQAFKAAGINRVSLGAQSFDDALLKTLSRTHSSSQAINAVEHTYLAGIENISIDLMYDLPNQTLHYFKQSVQKALELPITHLTLYNLTIEPHTPFYKHKQNLKLPNESTSLQMLNFAVNTLENARFKRYEIAAFAKQNQVSKHNIGYWTNRPFLGFGPSAFSYWNQSRFRNHANLQRYSKALAKGELPLDFFETLSPHEKVKESLAIGLRCVEGIYLKPLSPKIKKSLVEFETLGFVKKCGQRLQLTKKGLLFHDLVAQKIMEI